jgi:translocator protein
MGYASFRVWDEGDGFKGRARSALIIYILQLILNWTWSITFFKLHLIGWALVHIATLLIVIIINGLMFYQVDRIAGYLFIPYIAWVSFATVLSATIWRLNSTSSS